MAGRERFDERGIILAIRECGGVYPAARKLGVSHTAIYNYVSKYPGVAEAVNELNETKAIKREKRTRHHSVVYFIRESVFGYTKIGWSSRGVRTRLSRLQVGCPQELSLIGFIVCRNSKEAKALEGILHRRFFSCAVRGEWHDIPQATIEDLKKEYPVQVYGSDRVSRRRGS